MILRDRLKGLFTALVTPFSSDGREVDARRLAEHVRFQAAGGAAGVVACGTTGESPTLSEAEYRRVVETTIETARDAGLLAVAGTGSNSTAHAVELHRFAAEAGADASLQVNPYYNKPSQEGLYRHFATIADAADLPIVLYNIPGRTGVALSIGTIERLAGHPNVVAMKDATGGLDLVSEMRRRTDLVILSGDDPLTLPLVALGGSGVISVIGNVVPDRVSDLCRLALAGDFEGARRVHEELLPLAKGLLSLDTNPVPVKTAMKILKRDSGALRLPLCPPGEAVEREIERLLRESGVGREAVAAGARRA